MCSKRAASPFPLCDLTEPKAIRIGFDMRWKDMPEYIDVAFTRDRIWRSLQVVGMPAKVNEEDSFRYFRDVLHSNAIHNPYKFILDLRQECPSFATMAISANSIKDLDGVMAHPEVTAWVRRKVRALTNEYYVSKEMQRLSRNLFWAVQLGLASMSHLHIIVRSSEGCYWQAEKATALSQYVISIASHKGDVGPGCRFFGLIVVPEFLCPDELMLQTSTPYFKVPSDPPIDYFPERLPRCFVELDATDQKVDLTPYILYAPILVELLHTVLGLDELIIHHIASFLWPGVMSP